MFEKVTFEAPGDYCMGTLDKHRVLDETDHIPATLVYIRETLAWLDRTLGPVNR